ncbi:MAG: ATP-dependent DNA ligase [Eubacteriales bacterium]
MELILPMEPIISKKIPSEDQWIHQIKWDGIRAITYIEHQDYKIYTKKGNERTKNFSEFKDITKIFLGKQGIIDGEIVVFDELDRPNFQYVIHRERRKTNVSYYQRKYPAYYILFDILFLNGKDLRGYAYEERIAILKKNIKKDSRIVVTDNFYDGFHLFRLMKEKNYEGIVSKRKSSLYISGKKHKEWFKIKITKMMLTVIGGLKYKDNLPNSLLIGIYQSKKLFYLGNVAIGLKESDKIIINKYKSKLEQKESSFTNYNEDNIIWLQPVLTCWISFLERTNNGGLRHPKIIGFSQEKPEEADGREYTNNDNN